MWTTDSISRRSFFAAAAAASALPATAKKKIPLGLELYSVRDVLPKDLFGVVKGVAKMGYEGVEFYSAYYSWKPDYAKEVRKLLDDLRIKCYSTHNDAKAFAPENLAKSIELNSILGGKIIVMASAGRVDGIDGWKKVAETLSAASTKFKTAGIRAGYHNHAAEFKPIDGVLPLEVLAKNTPKDVTLQLDVGTCVETASDPVAWINQHPGRINSIHCKDWGKGPDKGYKVLFGDGDSPWKKIFQAAEKKGGVEYYIIEQEGSAYPSMETAERCYKAFRKLHG
jgi:sugar phosphate isomerase/epimerase